MQRESDLPPRGQDWTARVEGEGVRAHRQIVDGSERASLLVTAGELRADFSRAQITYEVFGSFSLRFEEIKRVEIAFLLEKWVRSLVSPPSKRSLILSRAERSPRFPFASQGLQQYSRRTIPWIRGCLD